MYSGLISEAEKATCESARVDFKRMFDARSKGDWCELLKDICAMANSGGGIIVFGVDDAGAPTTDQTALIANCDPADITNKLFSYTGSQFADFRIDSVKRNNMPCSALVIGAVRVPLVFISAGNYQGADGKPRCAFVSGSVYFRHGAKSEPCVTADLEAFVSREIDRIREAWLGKIRQVVEAPLDSEVQILSGEGTRFDEGAESAIRITADPNAPAHRLADPNLTHPYRQKEVVAEVNRRLQGKTSISSHDVLCVRRIHDVDSNPVFFYKARYSSPTYSTAFVDWIVEKFNADPQFFESCREQYHAG